MVKTWLIIINYYDENIKEIAVLFVLVADKQWKCDHKIMSYIIRSKIFRNLFGNHLESGRHHLDYNDF